MAKKASQLDTEIQTALGLPPAVVKKFKSKLAAYRKAVADLEAGYTDAKLMKMAKARDAIDYTIWDATAHVPYDAGKAASSAAPIVEMQRERDELVRSTWERAKERGHEANAKAHSTERKRIDEEIREANRPYEWMKR